jgi:hypothetical protein
LLSDIARKLPSVRFRTERLQKAEHDEFTFRFRPAASNPTPAAPIGLILPRPPRGTPARRRRAVQPEAAHLPTKGFIMKHSLILLALAATFTLSACQKDAPPPVVQVIAGPAGAPGATGATGATGAEAQAGATGATGATGAVGDTGAKGTAGATGDTGAQGYDGAKGEAGATGYDGAKGEAGATGATGYDGEKGDKGRTGDTVVVLPQR